MREYCKVSVYQITFRARKTLKGIWLLFQHNIRVKTQCIKQHRDAVYSLYVNAVCVTRNMVDVCAIWYKNVTSVIMSCETMHIQSKVCVLTQVPRWKTRKKTHGVTKAHQETNWNKQNELQKLGELIKTIRQEQGIHKDKRQGCQVWQESTVTVLIM